MYGFIITTAGQEVLARAAAGEQLTISQVQVGKGVAASAEAAAALEALIDPVAAGTSTVPAVSGGQLTLIVEYRNDMNGGLSTGFDLSEFGIFASVGDDAPVLLYYASLGDSPQPVQPESEGLDVHRFPVAVAVTGNLSVALGYPADAFVRAQDLQGYAPLGSDGKVPAAYLPAMNYDPAGSAQTVQNNLNAHTRNKNNPHGVTAAQIGAVPTTRKVNNKALSADVSLSAADVGALPISGGTLTGNLDGQYIKGTWLRGTADNHLSGAATKICVQDQDGWVYHRTAAEIRSDIGVPAAIQAAIGNAIAASY